VVADLGSCNYFHWGWVGLPYNQFHFNRAPDMEC